MTDPAPARPPAAEALTEPMPKLWWSPSRQSFFCMLDAAVAIRPACESGHEMWTGYKPVPKDAVALTAQPSPTAPDTAAEVLAGLVEEMEQESYHLVLAGHERVASGVRRAIALVEAAQQRLDGERGRFRFASREQAADIAGRMDWNPTCLPGQERATIVWQVLNAVIHEGVHPDARAAAPAPRRPRPRSSDD